MDAPTPPQRSDKASQLQPLAEYITGLWKLGGIPLVMVGLGALNLFFPTSSVYTEPKQFLITSFLFVSGLLTWGSLTFLAFKRWSRETELLGQRETVLIEAVVRIVERADGDVAKTKTNLLRETLPILGVRPVEPLSLPGQTAALRT